MNTVHVAVTWFVGYLHVFSIIQMADCTKKSKRVRIKNKTFSQKYQILVPWLHMFWMLFASMASHQTSQLTYLERVTLSTTISKKRPSWSTTLITCILLCFTRLYWECVCLFHSPVDCLLDMWAGRANRWRARLSRVTLWLVSMTVGSLDAVRALEDPLLVPALLSLFAWISPAISSQYISLQSSTNKLHKCFRGPQDTYNRLASSTLNSLLCCPVQ